MSGYPDRYVITAVAAAGARDAGKRFWLYWSEEGGGWWQWGPEGWAHRFAGKSGQRFDDAMACAAEAGPWWAEPDPSTIEARPVKAIVTVS